MTIFGLREALGAPTAPAWRRFVARLTLACDGSDACSRNDVQKLVSQTTTAVRINEFIAVLIALEVFEEIPNAYRVRYERAQMVTAALQVLDEESDDERDAWQIVATIPKVLDRSRLPDNLVVTKACILQIIETTRDELWLASPFMDYRAISFVKDPLADVLRHRGRVRILTTGVNIDFTTNLLDGLAEVAPLENLTVWEAPTVTSLLGTHAKAIVSDGRLGYLGSANLTGPGLDEHFELGVRLAGPGVAALVRILEAIAGESPVRFPYAEMMSDA